MIVTLSAKRLGRKLRILPNSSRRSGGLSLGQDLVTYGPRAGQASSERSDKKAFLATHANFGSVGYLEGA